MNPMIKFGILLVTLIWAAVGWSYPLDGYPYTGILRLEGFRLAQQGKVRGIKIPMGARLNSDQVDLRLRDRRDLTIPPIDPDFTDAVQAYLGEDANN